MAMTVNQSITGVILAGGKGSRMGGDDKGLLNYKNKPLVHYVIDRIAPQVDTLIINANRNLAQYQQFGYRVISDSLTDFCGPLSGMLSAMQIATTDYILTSPCDCPYISAHLRRRLMEALLIERADIAVAHDGKRMQPVFCLIACRLKDDLKCYLDKGERKIDIWLTEQQLAVGDFSDETNSFINFNYPDDLVRHTLPVVSPVPILGIAALSGTGKTTLLRRLIPVLTEKGLKIAILKHAHHDFDIDIPGKDSYELRQAGACQVLVSSSRLKALMAVPSPATEPTLSDLVPMIDTKQADIILVEGFKSEHITKIELHRPSLGKPLLCTDDRSIIAIATDEPITVSSSIDQLDLNNIETISNYIYDFINCFKS